MLLWLAAALVALLAAYLFVGWLRRAQNEAGWRQQLGPILLAGAALGVGITSAMPLALAAEALSFKLGYNWFFIPALVLGPMVGTLPAAFWLARKQNWWALIGCGLWLGLLAVAVQAGWILAAGLRPGIRWSFELLGGAAAVTTLGMTAALWLAYSDASSEGARKTLWRVGAAALMSLSLIAGQEVVTASVALLSQVGSVYQRQAASTWVCLVAGALVPTVLAILALDLALRNRAGRSRRRSGGGVELVLPKRRKRRRKYRAL